MLRKMLSLSLVLRAYIYTVFVRQRAMLLTVFLVSVKYKYAIYLLKESLFLSLFEIIYLPLINYAIKYIDIFYEIHLQHLITS